MRICLCENKQYVRSKFLTIKRLNNYLLFVSEYNRYVSFSSSSHIRFTNGHHSHTRQKQRKKTNNQKGFWRYELYGVKIFFRNKLFKRNKNIILFSIKINFPLEQMFLEYSVNLLSDFRIRHWTSWNFNRIMFRFLQKICDLYRLLIVSRCINYFCVLYLWISGDSTCPLTDTSRPLKD